MTDYISREAALDALCKASTPCFSSAGKPILVFDVDYVPAINSIPAADVRPVVHGRWEKGTGENGVTTSLFCSVCHYENRHWHEWNYCPNCGAEMEES